MNATMSKQEVREVYIASVQDAIFIRNGLIHIPSSDSNHEYIVTLKDGKADDCGCDDHYCKRHFCKHLEAVERWLAHQQIATQPIEATQEDVIDEPTLVVVVTPEAEEQHEHVLCGGCGCVCGEGKGEDCTPNFCKWHSFYTEGLRIQEDERIKQAAKQQREAIAA